MIFSGKEGKVKSLFYNNKSLTRKIFNNVVVVLFHMYWYLDLNI